MNRILNFGSLNMDYVYTVERFVTAGETIPALGYEIFPGGKGLNQSIALSLAGGNVSHAGKVGKDGLFLVNLLKEKGVDISRVLTNGSHTGHAIIQVDKEGQNCILIHGGANKEINHEDILNSLEGFSNSILVLQNEISRVGEIMDAAYELGMDIAFNPSPASAEINRYPLEKIRWLLLNEIEGELLSGEKDPEKICLRINSLYPSVNIVLTLGGEGAVCFSGKRFFRQGIYKAPVVDTTAAGDTFTGYFLAGISRSESIPRALKLAAIAAAIAVSRKGASSSIPDMDEVLSFEAQLDKG